MEWHERFMCWLESLSQDGVDRNCQQFWKTTTMVCYECIHCHLFIAVLLSILDTFCHAILSNCHIVYISYTCCELKFIFCIQERHLGILWFVFQGYGTRELTFSILKSTFQVKKQYFAVIATYISSAETIIVVKSWNSCYTLKLYLTFKCEDYIWCI